MDGRFHHVFSRRPTVPPMVSWMDASFPEIGVSPEQPYPLQGMQVEFALEATSLASHPQYQLHVLPQWLSQDHCHVRRKCLGTWEGGWLLPLFPLNYYPDLTDHIAPPNELVLAKKTNYQLIFPPPDSQPSAILPLNCQKAPQRCYQG